MKPLLQHLENESLLLLYIAGELPSQDREELEMMLRRDGGLRSQLASLEASQSASFSALAQLDAIEHLRAAEPALRYVDRSIQQWQIDRLARPAKVVAVRSKTPVWAWSAGSAVAALLVFCIWWGFRTDGNPGSVSTQPFNSSLNSLANGPSNASPNPTGMSQGVANGERAPSVWPEAVPRNPDSNPSSVQIVTVDAETAQLSELERKVNDDLASSLPD
jgi:hypothetical protein